MYEGTYLVVASTLANIVIARNTFLRHWGLELADLVVSVLHNTQYSELRINDSSIQSSKFVCIFLFVFCVQGVPKLMRGCFIIINKYNT